MKKNKLVAKVAIKKENDILQKTRVSDIREISCDDVAHTLEKTVGFFVTHKSMEMLDKSRWLNDKVIHCYMKLLEIYSMANSELKVKCQNTGFIDKILQCTNDIDSYDYKSVRRWMRERIEDVDIILYPINITQYHWALVVVYTNNKCIQYYNYSGGNKDLYLRTLRRYVQNHGDRNEWEFVGDAHLGPQQTSGNDCGVFVCISGFWIVHGKIPSYNERYIRRNGRSSINSSI